jgi:hypothetical protein
MNDHAGSWLPPDFAHPERVELSAGHHLRPIREDDVAIDYPAVMGSRERLWSIFGEPWVWPPATMTSAQDQADLARHEREIRAHLAPSPHRESPRAVRTPDRRAVQRARGLNGAGGRRLTGGSRSCSSGSRGEYDWRRRAASSAGGRHCGPGGRRSASGTGGRSGLVATRSSRWDAAPGGSPRTCTDRGPSGSSNRSSDRSQTPCALRTSGGAPIYPGVHVLKPNPQAEPQPDPTRRPDWPGGDG